MNLLLLLLVSLLSYNPQQPSTFDGTWWNAQSESGQVFFLAGFYASNRWTLRNLNEAGVLSENNARAATVANITIEDMRFALGAFYASTLHARVPVGKAIFLVLDSWYGGG